MASVVAKGLLGLSRGSRKYVRSLASLPGTSAQPQSDNFVSVVEVGPRDGLQNEPRRVSVEHKVQLIERLADCGLGVIEAGSFVSPKWVPQMADSIELMSILRDSDRKCRYTALVPNMKGLEAATASRELMESVMARDGDGDESDDVMMECFLRKNLKCGVREVAVFAAASQTFSLKNINCSIEDSLRRFESVIKCAKENDVLVRGYVSCAMGCPYDGAIPPKEVAWVCSSLASMGVYEVSVGDTIGVGTPLVTGRVLREVLRALAGGDVRVALHCHDTYGQALANVLVALELGVRTVDASVSGLGGCPYARGASGNLATEDLVYMLHGSGMKTGINLGALCETSVWISELLQRKPQSKVTLARCSRELRASVDSK